MELHYLYGKLTEKEILYPALWHSMDEGEAWDLGDSIGVLEKEPDFIQPYQFIGLALHKSMEQAAADVEETRKQKGEKISSPSFRCLWAFVVWSKDVSDERGDAAYLPVRVYALIQENLLKNVNPYANPVWSPTMVVTFDGKGNREIDNIELKQDLSKEEVGKYMLLRHKATEALSNKPIVVPTKIGTMLEGMKSLYGVESYWDMVKQHDENPKNKTGCVIPFALFVGSLAAASVAVCCGFF